MTSRLPCTCFINTALQLLTSVISHNYSLPSLLFFLLYQATASILCEGSAEHPTSDVLEAHSFLHVCPEGVEVVLRVPSVEGDFWGSPTRCSPPTVSKFWAMASPRPRTLPGRGRCPLHCLLRRIPACAGPSWDAGLTPSSRGQCCPDAFRVRVAPISPP